MVDYDTIKKCVDGADYVLHIGAMVSPAADKYPEKKNEMVKAYEEWAKRCMVEPYPGQKKK